MATSPDHQSDEAPVGAPLPSTQRSLAFALLRAREKVMTPIRAMLAEAGITEQQWRVLRVLDEFGPLEASKVPNWPACCCRASRALCKPCWTRGW